jgi:sulfotransferase
MAGGRAEELDRRLGTPGLHKVGRRVESTGRKSVLPGDLVRKYENDAF